MQDQSTCNRHATHNSEVYGDGNRCAIVIFEFAIGCLFVVIELSGNVIVENDYYISSLIHL